jgi:hypothetical protein
MIPSGYKEDVVYSPIPTNGNGDLSFTRASNGTRINSAGLVEVCPWNELTYSEDFTNGAWFKSAATVSADATTAPNGTTTADKIVATATSGNHFVTRFATSYTGEFTFSVYAKSSEYTTAKLQDVNAGIFNCTYDLSNGTASGTGATIQNVGGGWYRCIVTFTSSGSSIALAVIGTPTTTINYTGDGTSGIFVWGGQLNIGSTAKPYFPTTDRLNVPRLTYQNGGGGCPSLLLEKQSTNIVLYSEQFDNAAWTLAFTSVTANSTTSPDGTQNADKIVEDTSNSAHGIYQSATITSGVSWTWSGFFKAAGRTKFRLYAQSASTPYVEFNLSNGTIISTSGSVTGSIESMGNGWYRCIATATTSGTTGYFNIAIADASGNVSYTGDGTSGLFVWGAQLEQSSYATSLISTTSASATRVADACSKTGISSLIGQTEGTLFIDINRNYITSSYDRYFAVDDGDATIYRTGIFIIPEPSIDGRVYIEIRSNSVGIFGFTYNSTSVSNLKIAVAYKNNDMAIYINGTQSATSSASLTFAHTLSKIASYGNGQSIKESVIFPTRLTNAELASLTTL